LGQLDDTYIVFTSDHGIALGSHGLMGKQNLYEHSWRVPLIVRGPGIPAGSRASGYVYLLDLLPTLCDLAGVDTPEAVEGLSFRPVLEGRRQQIRDVLYGVYCGGTKPGMRAVKSDGWKLIEYDVLDGAVRETQLFNLAENPNELLAEHQARDIITWVGATPSAQQIDLAEIDRFAAKRAELETLLTKQMELFGDPYELQ
jgi:choline-sulfatase